MSSTLPSYSANGTGVPSAVVAAKSYAVVILTFPLLLIPAARADARPLPRPTRDQADRFPPGGLDGHFGRWNSSRTLLASYCEQSMTQPFEGHVGRTYA